MGGKPRNTSGGINIFFLQIWVSAREIFPGLPTDLDQSCH
jgi:hypothetical protein